MSDVGVTVLADVVIFVGKVVVLMGLLVVVVVLGVSGVLVVVVCDASVVVEVVLVVVVLLPQHCCWLLPHGVCGLGQQYCVQGEILEYYYLLGYK